MVVNHRESVSGHLLYKVSKKQHLEPSMHHLQHCAQSRQLQHRICPAQLCAGKQLAWAGCPLCFQGQLQGEAANSLITLLSSLPIKSLRSGKTLKSNDRSRFYKNLHVLLSLWEDVGALTNPGNKIKHAGPAQDILMSYLPVVTSSPKGVSSGAHVLAKRTVAAAPCRL